MKENVFGIPMNVVSRAEAIEQSHGERMTQAVMRCADLRQSSIPAEIRSRNIVVPCSRCNHSCWLDTRTCIPDATIVCLPCLTAAGEHYKPFAVREVVDEVRRHYPEA